MEFSALGKIKCCQVTTELDQILPTTEDSTHPPFVLTGETSGTDLVFLMTEDALSACLCWSAAGPGFGQEKVRDEVKMETRR